MLAAGTAAPDPTVPYTAVPAPGPTTVDAAATAVAIAAAFQNAARDVV